MKQVLIEDEDGTWWKFVVPASFGEQVTYWPAGYKGPYFAIQPYMEGDGWEFQEESAMGPSFHHCINGELKTPHLLFGLAGDEGAVKGKLVKMKP